MNQETLCEAIVEKFGAIERCYMPTEQMRNQVRNKGFAIINFKFQSSAERALQEEDFILENAVIQI